MGGLAAPSRRAIACRLVAFGSLLLVYRRLREEIWGKLLMSKCSGAGASYERIFV